MTLKSWERNNFSKIISSSLSDYHVEFFLNSSHRNGRNSLALQFLKEFKASSKTTVGNCDGNSTLSWASKMEASPKRSKDDTALHLNFVCQILIVSATKKGHNMSLHSFQHCQIMHKSTNWPGTVYLFNSFFSRQVIDKES